MTHFMPDEVTVADLIEALKKLPRQDAKVVVFSSLGHVPQGVGAITEQDDGTVLID